MNLIIPADPNRYLSPMTITWVCKNTSTDSELRHALVDQCAYSLKKENLKKSMDNGTLSKDLFFDISMVYKRDALACRGGSACKIPGEPSFEKRRSGRVTRSRRRLCSWYMELTLALGFRHTRRAYRWDSAGLLVQEIHYWTA
jgi:hypothetical protein